MVIMVIIASCSDSYCGEREQRRLLVVVVCVIGVPRGGAGGPWPPLAKIFCLAEQNWVAWQKRN